MSIPDIPAVRAHLEELQTRICASLEGEDGAARFDGPTLEDERGGLSKPRVLEGGAVIERAGVNLSHSIGDALPPAATERRPELAGRGFQAVSLSLIVHPRNPRAPTTHMNVRAFAAEKAGAEPVWWFGGGFDLTPYYGYEEDCRHWHATARDACGVLGPDAYPRFKAWCDEYFHLAHRGEPRGIGGVFYDDLCEEGWESCFALHRAVGDAFLDAYIPILRRRVDEPFGERERSWQLLRRGRYVEFNLLYDRGTRYGLQSGRRVESVLASMPPLVRWEHDHRPEPGSEEARLLEAFLVPRDWV